MPHIVHNNKQPAFFIFIAGEQRQILPRWALGHMANRTTTVVNSSGFEMN